MNLSKRKDFWRNLCKRLRIQREKTCASLALYTLLVIYGVKPAYLIDVCSLDVDQAKYLVQELLNFSQSSEKIKIVQVGGDIFVVNTAQFRDRMSILLESLTKEDEDQVVPTFAVIDLDFKPESSEIFVESMNFYPRVKGSTTNEEDIENFGINFLIGSLSAMELNQLFSSFSNVFDQNNDQEVLCITTTSELYQNLGGPLIAGLLLGYPSVYKTVPNFRARRRDEVNNLLDEDEFMSPLYERACNKLSFKQLAKVTVFLDIEINDSFLHRAISPSSNSVNASIAMLEFTYPLSIHSTSESADFRLETLRKIIDNLLQENLSSCVSNGSPLSRETGRSDIFRILQKRLEIAEWNAEGISL